MENQTQISSKFRVVGVFFSKASEIKEQFRCPLCSKLLMVHNGEVESIEFLAPKIESQFGSDVLCSRCKVIYRIVYN
jgi:uncharacterized protein with PIN domain